MATFAVRPACRDDLPGVQETQYRALADMHRRHGLPVPPEPAELSPLWPHLLDHHAGGGFWVAEAGGQVVGFFNGLRREGTWFLSNFWVRPDWQGRGVGRQLAARMREAMAGAAVTSVYASYDPPAMHTYLSLGMRPLAPFFRFGLELEPPCPRPRPGKGMSGTWQVT